MTGRVRPDLATEQVRAVLAARVHSAAERHGIPLPTDVPQDLLD